jgi:tetratricopeptide (TPR) repeat protein
VSLDLLGSALDAAEDRAAAEAVLRAAQRRHPDDVWVNYNLARVLEALSRTDEAHRYYTAARSIRPETAHELAHALESRGESDEAIEVFRRLCLIRARNGRHLTCFGRASQARGRAEESGKILVSVIAALREEIQLHPDHVNAHSNLGNALDAQGKLDEAIAECRTTIKLKPDVAGAHRNPGAAFSQHGKLDEAIAEYRTAINLSPDFAGAHGNLGYALTAQGKLEEAIAEYRIAIELKPDYAEAHCDLGMRLRGRGSFAEAVQELRKGHDLGSRRPDWRFPSAQWLAEAETMAAVANRLPAIVRGDDKPRDAAEGFGAGQICYYKGLHAAAARLYAEALALDPKRGSDRKALRRYRAACSAALAGSGQSKDVPPPDEATRRRLRDQARDWLMAELADWAKFLQSQGPGARPFVAQMVQHWKVAPELTGIRDRDAVKRLPADEQKACEALWKEVDAVPGERGASAPCLQSAVPCP